MRRLFILALLLGLSIVSLRPVLAQEQADRQLEASFSSTGILRDQSIFAFNAIEVGLPAGRISAATVVAVTELGAPLPAPSGLTMAGRAYRVTIPFETFSPGDYYLSLKSSGSSAYKQVFYLDGSAWKPLPTTENFLKGTVNTAVSRAAVTVAIFENSRLLVSGQASWYRYKGGLFAASPDFPAGTRLRVINLDTKKSVDVTVNDHGPDRRLHPTRVVDLDAVAFERIAPLGQGTARVAIQKIDASTPLPAPAPVLTPAASALTINAKSAVILNSADKKVLWSKEADKVVPLASLTKLVAVRTFLDTKPDLKKVVAYSVKDEQLNYKYVSPAQSGALHLKDKDTVTIKDLVHASLIGSTNNTVETLVRISGLSRDAFIKKMNANAAAWGAKKTRFVEPTGLSPQNVTTASEYAIISREVFMSPIIATATTMPSYTVKTINTKIAHSFKNTNLLARDAGAGLLGSKTGFINEAGNCLVTKWPTAQNKNIILVVLGASTRQASVDDTKSLLAFARQTIK